jgi:glycine/D-amino acid oxidase-like deaminating enzyme
MHSRDNVRSADIVICGAGIAGAAAAYHLAVRQRVRRVVLIDEREPLTLTSDKGTQGYRNWWPGPDDTMLRFVSRSIDLAEESALESGNVFRLNRRGYVFATAEPDEVRRLESTARIVASYGMGPVRKHTDLSDYQPHNAEGFLDQPIGADLLLDTAARAAFPYLTPDTIGALHIRRAGTMNSVALGEWFIKRAVAHGAQFVRDRVVGIDSAGGRVRGVRLASGQSVGTERVVIAAGPAVPDFGAMLGIDVPVMHELHLKLTFRDRRRFVARDAPFVIWNDPITFHGREFPAGMHFRPVDLAGGDELYLIWTYETDLRSYVWPPAIPGGHDDILLRGLTRMIPGAAEYVGSGTGVVDGGYYCKTRENRPLIGPLPIEGAYILAALSGIGLMSAHAAAELCALHATEGRLPDYAPAFLPSRYQDPAYVSRVEQWGKLVGQL